MSFRQTKLNKTNNSKLIIILKIIIALLIIILIPLLTILGYKIINYFKIIAEEEKILKKVETRKLLEEQERLEKERMRLEEEEKLDKEISEMSIEEKVGQMMVIPIPGKRLSEKSKKQLKRIKPGGVIMMGDSYGTYSSTLKLIKDIKKTSKIPMIVSTDQEGGLVQRLQGITDVKVSNIPSMYKIGRKKDTELAYEIGSIIAKQLRTLGINLTYAPTLDILSNPDNELIGDRAFSSQKNVVAELGISLAQGIEENGVNTCVKHFPGHGDTIIDSHFHLPRIRKTESELNELELVPFKKAIQSGVKMFMVGHISLPTITKVDEPASLSKKIITDLLKNKMGYKGLVITDALNMGAILNEYNEEEVVIKAVYAGVDLLLLPQNNDAMFDAFVKAVKDKKIPESLVDKSVKKILKYKKENIKENYLEKSFLNKAEYDKILNEAR